MVKAKKIQTKKKATEELAVRDFTVNLHKRLHGICAKKRAPRALKEIKALAVKQMGTKDVRVDTTLNKFIWSRGIAHVPFRVRVRCERKRNEDEEAAERTYTLVSFVNVDSFKGLTTENVNTTSA